MLAQVKALSAQVSSQRTSFLRVVNPLLKDLNEIKEEFYKTSFMKDMQNVEDIDFKTLKVDRNDLVPVSEKIKALRSKIIE